MPPIFVPGGEELNSELWDVWADLSSDPAVDVAILSGNGKAFCAESDIAAFLQGKSRMFSQITNYSAIG